VSQLFLRRNIMQDSKLAPTTAQFALPMQPPMQSERARRSSKLRSYLAAGAVVGALAMPGTARAGCCDDFWSCGAAFVTGGLSCVLQAAQEESRRILDAARRALDGARRSYNEAVNGTQNKVNESRDKAQKDGRDSMAAMDAAKNTVQAKINTPIRVAAFQPNAATQAALQAAQTRLPAVQRSAMVGQPSAPTPPPAQAVIVTAPNVQRQASPEDVRRALEDAARTIESLRQRGQNQDLPAVSQAIARMNDNVGRSIGNLQGIVRQAVFTPLEEILRILGAADPTGLTNLIAAAVTGLDAATTALDTEVFRGMQALDDVLVGALGEVENHVSELVSAADLSRNIQAKVNALSEQPTQAQIDALRSLLPPEPARPLNANAIRAISGLQITTVQRYNLNVPKTALTANTMKLALAPLNNQLKDPLLKSRLQPPAEKAQFKSQLDQYLGNEFTGLSGAPRAAKRQQLIDEARRRFASNPQQAQEMERLIAQAAGPVINSPALMQQLPPSNVITPIPQRSPIIPPPMVPR
jgi:hypothetical protein